MQRVADDCVVSIGQTRVGPVPGSAAGLVSVACGTESAFQRQLATPAHRSRSLDRRQLQHICLSPDGRRTPRGSTCANLRQRRRYGPDRTPCERSWSSQRSRPDEPSRSARSQRPVVPELQVPHHSKARASESSSGASFCSGLKEHLCDWEQIGACYQRTPL